MKVAVTGHRPQNLRPGDEEWIKHELDRLIIKLFPSLGLTGMAIGVDTWWTQALLNAGIPFHGYVPFRGQEKRWHRDDQKTYHYLLARAERVVTISEHHLPHVYHERNERMVDNCDLLVAAYNGKESGGTHHCFEYAKAKHVPIVHVNPDTQRTILLRPTGHQASLGDY